MMTADVLYEERVSSRRTQALFLALTLLSLLLLWRLRSGGLRGWAWGLLCMAVLFFFYTINYRTLVISLTARALRLRFGIFTWSVPIDNVSDCALDDLPPLMAMGGAGIHFMFVRKRYRVSFNFLEYPRVVVALRQKVGPVRDVSFSTQNPDRIVRLVRDAVAARRATRRDQGED